MVFLFCYSVFIHLSLMLKLGLMWHLLFFQWYNSFRENIFDIRLGDIKLCIREERYDDISV